MLTSGEGAVSRERQQRVRTGGFEYGVLWPNELTLTIQDGELLHHLRSKKSASKVVFCFEIRANSYKPHLSKATYEMQVNFRP